MSRWTDSGVVLIWRSCGITAVNLRIIAHNTHWKLVGTIRFYAGKRPLISCRAIYYMCRAYIENILDYVTSAYPKRTAKHASFNLSCKSCTIIVTRTLEYGNTISDACNSYKTNGKLTYVIYGYLLEVDDRTMSVIKVTYQHKTTPINSHQKYN